MIDLLDAGGLSCPELVQLVATLRAADAAGMTVALASSDRRLIDVLELTGVPVTISSSVRAAREQLGPCGRTHPR